jgi:hypothetical protein
MEETIIVRIQGGLGNQLFQYASGAAVAARARLQLKVDVQWYKAHTDRQFLLDKFNTDIDIANEKEVQMAKGAHDLFIDKALRKIKLRKEKFFFEKEFVFDPTVLKINHAAYLKGYWQHFQYFEEFSDEIKRQFQLKQLTDIARTVQMKIDNSNSIGIHLRRGDYITNSAFNKFHGVLDEHYYRTAIEVLMRKVPDASLYVFSDDINFAQQFFHSYKKVEVVTGNKDEEDLILLSSCKHQIIANSTFSWWSAWLNKNPDKVVIAPQKWFADPTRNAQTKSIIPHSWLRI